LGVAAHSDASAVGVEDTSAVAVLEATAVGVVNIVEAVVVVEASCC